MVFTSPEQRGASAFITRNGNPNQQTNNRVSVSYEPASTASLPPRSAVVKHLILKAQKASLTSFPLDCPVTSVSLHVCELLRHISVRTGVHRRGGFVVRPLCGLWSATEARRSKWREAALLKVRMMSTEVDNEQLLQDTLTYRADI